MNETSQITSFPVTLFGQLEQYNQTISKVRVRVFYRGKNRNGSYITDDFAKTLISSIPYAPIKGIYSENDKDFTNHGEDRTEGRIYGVVAAEPNFAWEKHLDEDGIEREYACVDALIYTALYQEANDILGKSQSMELYKPSIKGDWKEIDGKRYFEFTDGCFLGLQILGDMTEPCFEGAAFFSLVNSLSDLSNNIGDQKLADALTTIYEHLSNSIENSNSKQEEVNMIEITYRLSDEGKRAELYKAISQILGNENEPCGCYIVSVYDDYAVVEVNPNEFERFYYVKNDESESVEITKREVCYIVDVNEKEKAALATLKALNQNSFENLDVQYEKLTTENAEISQNYELKIKELNELIATLNVDRENYLKSIEALKTDLSNALTDCECGKKKRDEMQLQLNELNEYKFNVEKLEKERIISEYKGILSESILETYSANIDTFSCEELDMKLAYETKKNTNIFSINESQTLIPKNRPLSGLEAILNKYESGDRK